MGEVFVIDPQDVPHDEYDQWNEILVNITDSGIHWMRYANSQGMIITVAQLFSPKFYVHASERDQYKIHGKQTNVTTLVELKVMALKVMVTS